MAQQVFVSYAHVDKDWVNKELKKKLIRFKFDVWIDADRLRAGENWRTGIDDAISQSFAVIVVMTNAAFESKYVTYEWGFAIGLGKAVIPVFLQKSNMHPRLESLQYLDFTEGWNAPWDALKKTLEKAEKAKPSAGAAQVMFRYLDEGRSLYQKNDLYNALHAFEDALKLASSNLNMRDDIHYDIALTLIKLKDITQAEIHLLKAVNYNDKHTRALVQLGHIYRGYATDEEKKGDMLLRESQLAKAANEFATALTIQDDILDEFGEPVWASLGGIRRRLGQIDLAIDAYKRAAKVKKDSSYAYNNLGLLYMEVRNLDRMQSNFHLVEKFAQIKIANNPADTWGYNDLLVSRLVLNKIDMLEEAVNMICTVGEESGSSAIETINRISGFQILSQEAQDLANHIIERIENFLSSINN